MPAAEPHDDCEYVDFPGAAVPASTKISFTGGDISPMDPIPCYRALRSSGEPYAGAEVPHSIGKELAVKMHEVCMYVIDRPPSCIYPSELIECMLQLNAAARCHYCSKA